MIAARITSFVIQVFSNPKSRNILIGIVVGIISFFIVIVTFFVTIVSILVATATNSFYYPIPDHTYISSSFAPARINPVTGILESHRGTDFPCPEGTTVLASASGTVLSQTQNSIEGIKLVIDHDNGTQTVYKHLSGYLCEVGDVVLAGTPVALSGNTGESTNGHLHFEIIINGEYIDAETLLQPWPEGYFDNPEATVVATNTNRKDIFIHNDLKRKIAIF